jgi:hypothetical protein
MMVRIDPLTTMMGRIYPQMTQMNADKIRNIKVITFFAFSNFICVHLRHLRIDCLPLHLQIDPPHPLPQLRNDH